MRVATLTKFASWAIIIVLGVAAVAISEGVGLSQKWEEGIGYTVVLFTVLVTVLRPAWGRPRFWRNLALLFTLHVGGRSFFCQLCRLVGTGCRSSSGASL